jgi:hypothetical protein
MHVGIDHRADDRLGLRGRRSKGANDGARRSQLDHVSSAPVAHVLLLVLLRYL